LIAAAFLGDDGVAGEMRTEPLNDQLLRGAVGFGHQIVFAFQFESDPPLEQCSEQGSGFPSDFSADFEIGRNVPSLPLE